MRVRETVIKGSQNQSHNPQTGFQTTLLKKSQMGNSEYALIQAKPQIEPSEDPSTQYRRLKKNFHFQPMQKFSTFFMSSRHSTPLSWMKNPPYSPHFTGQPVATVTSGCHLASGPKEYQREEHQFLDGLEGVINIAQDISVFGCGN